MAAAVSVAVIGTGRMGAAIARRLGGGDAEMVLYNRTTETVSAIAAELGSTVAVTAREAAAAADVCLVSLADDEAVRAIYDGPDGLVAGLRPGTVVCDTSTIDPSTVRALASLVGERGAILLDTPVSGSVPVVERGELTIMVGGDAGALEHARPVLERISKAIFHVGDQGAGAAMKLVVNGAVHALNIALSEALVLAEKAGLDRSATYDVLESSAVGAPFVSYKRQAFLRPEETAVAFSLRLVAKDQELIDRLAHRVGARMQQADANRRLVGEAVAAGLGDDDMSAIATFLR
jgi:3-hydroxyisobutyrate dehydrogenase-like beta-hydroxyacid dehydrogenase